MTTKKADISAIHQARRTNLRRLGRGDQELFFGDDTVELLAKRFQVECATLSQKMVAIFNANREMFHRDNMNAPNARRSNSDASDPRCRWPSTISRRRALFRII